MKPAIYQYKTLRAALLARVSTDEQEDRGTIKIQTEFARRHVDLQNSRPDREATIELVEMFCDDGVSGTIALDKRPEGARLLEAARRGEFTTLLIYKLDRLGRTARVILNAVDTLEKCGVTVVSMTEPFDTSNAFGRFVLTILAAVAEFERENILERTKTGRYKRANAGKWVGGPPPYGYVINSEGFLEEDTALIPQLDLSRADVIRMVFERAAHEMGTCVGIARLLDSNGVPTRFSGVEARLKHGNAGWAHTAVFSILTNPVYKGAPLYGRRGNGEVIEQTCPALVPETTWNWAQQQLVENRKHSVGQSKRAYWVTGCIHCTCGATYSGRSKKNASGKDYFYYMCNRQRPHLKRKDLNRPFCTNPIVNAEVLEQIIWTKLCQWVNAPETALQKIIEQQQHNGKQEEADQANLSRKKADLRTKELDRDRAFGAYSAGLVDMPTLERQFRVIDKDKGRLEGEIAEIEGRLRRVTQLDLTLNRAERALLEMQGKTDNPTPEYQREACRRMVHAAKIFPLTPEVWETFDLEEQHGPLETYLDSIKQERKRGALPTPYYVHIEWAFEPSLWDHSDCEPCCSAAVILLTTGTAVGGNGCP